PVDEGVGRLLAGSADRLLVPPGRRPGRSTGELHGGAVLAEEVEDAVDRRLAGDRAPGQDAARAEVVGDDRAAGACEERAVEIEDRRAAAHAWMLRLAALIRARPGALRRPRPLREGVDAHAAPELLGDDRDDLVVDGTRRSRQAPLATPDDPDRSRLQLVD